MDGGSINETVKPPHLTTKFFTHKKSSITTLNITKIVDEHAGDGHHDILGVHSAVCSEDIIYHKF